MAYKVGVVGLGVMGANLALNMERNGFAVVGYDLDLTKAQAFLQGPARGRKITSADSPALFMQLLEKPRRILIMVPAGAPVDSAITHLKPHLEPGDILMDGGNSYFLDTERRSKELEQSDFSSWVLGFLVARKVRSGDPPSCRADNEKHGTPWLQFFVLLQPGPMMDKLASSIWDRAGLDIT